MSNQRISLNQFSPSSSSPSLSLTYFTTSSSSFIQLFFLITKLDDVQLWLSEFFSLITMEFKLYLKQKIQCIYIQKSDSEIFQHFQLFLIFQLVSLFLLQIIQIINNRDKNMQMEKSPSTLSNFSSRNISNQQQIEKALQKQLQDMPTELCGFSSAPENRHIFSRARRPPNSKQRRMLKIELSRQDENKKIKNKVIHHNMLNYFPVYTTLMDSDFLINPNTRAKPENIGSLQTNRIKNAQQKSSGQRKRLAPLKKSNNNKSSFRNMHVSFLSVKKAPFLNQEEKSYDQNSMTVTANMFNKNKFVINKKSFQNSQTLYDNPQKAQQVSKVYRNKCFVAPFQRYAYFDFLWKISFSNKLKIEFPQNLGKKYKAYVGPGNNSNLIKTLLKRRDSWWSITDKIQDAHFIWTQIKVNNIFNNQKNSTPAAYVETDDSIIAQKTPIYRRNIKIMNQNETKIWIRYFHQNRQLEEKMPKSFKSRNRIMRNKQFYNIEVDKIKIHNHLPRNYVLGNKKALFSTMKKFYECSKRNVFQYLPLTFHIEKGLQDPQYYVFLKHFYDKAKQSKKNSKIKNIWIVKPGQFTNRGNGIIVCHQLEQIKAVIKKNYRLDNGGNRTYIVQQYLQRPFLYYGRKFDIRHYMLITFVNGHIKGYWCQLGYIRTTSYQYSINNAFSSVHLTNDAVQKHLPDYGKYQKGNKLSYQQFENYLKTQYSGRYSFFNTIYPQMKEIAHDSMRASSLLLDPDRKGHNFQIFGFDFMIDSKFHPWLIQINTNPCLQLSCPVLMQVIPTMLQNALKIGLDSVIPPPQSFEQKRARFSNNVLEQNNFQLLFDSTVEEKSLIEMMKGDKVSLNFKQLQKDQEEMYEDDGIMLDD